jgi:hypothetical protein
MKKIITLTLAVLFVTMSNLNAQDFNKYYEIYQKNKVDYSNIRKSKLFIKNQQNSNEFDDIKQRYSILKNSNKNSSINTSNQAENKSEFKSTIISEYQEVTEVRKKSKSRTVGNYFGIDFINTNLRFFDGGISEQNNVNTGEFFKSTYMEKYKNSFGLKYYYALNYRGFFLAPELFFEYNNTKKFIEYNANQNPLYNERASWRFGNEFLKIHKIYGGKINFGYDVNPNFAPFVFVGISRIYYSNLNSIYPRFVISKYPVFVATDVRQYMLDRNQKDPFAIMRNSTIDSFFGLGAKIKISERFLLNAEYLIYNKFKASKVYKNHNINNNEISTQDSAFSNQFDAYLRVAKIGLLYNF